MKILTTMGIFAGLSLVGSLVSAEELKREQDLSDKEGKPAPALQAENWMNTPDGKPLDLTALKGKVVVIDFWGTW